MLFDPIFVTATLLDPKFALCLSENQIGKSIQFLDYLLKRKQTENLDDDNNNEVIEIPNETEMQEENTFSNNILNEIIIESLNSKGFLSKKYKTEEEVTCYLQYLKNDFLNDFKLKSSYFGNLTKQNNNLLSPFQFWTNQIIISKFHSISKVACNILAIPASQSSCERVFSISGDFFSPNRNQLNPIKLQREVMFNYNSSLLNL